MAMWTDAYVAACADAGALPRDAALTLQRGACLHIAGNNPAHFHHRVSDDELGCLLRAASQLGAAVRELHLPYNCITAHGLQRLAEAMCGPLSHMTVVDISYNDVCDGHAALLVLAAALARDECALHTFLCAGNALGNDSGAALAHMLQVTHTLTHLDIHHTHLGMTSLVHLCDALAMNTTLVSLDMGRPLLHGPEEVKYVVHHLTLAMRRNTTLTRLCLDHFALCDDNMHMLLPALCASAVVSLSLRGNALSCDAGELLGRLLDRKQEFVLLDVSANRLSCAGACALATHVATHPSLCELHVANNAIDERGVVALVRAVCTCHSLHSLSLWGNAIRGDAVAELHRSDARLRKLREVDVTLYMSDGVPCACRA